MDFKPIITTRDLDLYYGDFLALQKIAIQIPPRNVTAIIGPSGCGKSTLLRCFNRMNDLADEIKVTGHIFIDDEDILRPDMDLIRLRQKVGMVFQRPNVFNLSIYENLRFGLGVHNLAKNKSDALDLIEDGLRQVSLWDELKNKLRKNARTLSLEQQQRLCIARVLILKPEIILLDEPCSALDPIATLQLEELLRVLREQYTIVIVTHNMQQAARVSDYTGFLYLGKLIEFDITDKIFTNPAEKLTENYIRGQFG